MKGLFWNAQIRLNIIINIIFTSLTNTKVNTRRLPNQSWQVIPPVPERREAAVFSLCQLIKLVTKALKLGSDNNLVLNFQIQLLGIDKSSSEILTGTKSSSEKMQGKIWFEQHLFERRLRAKAFWQRITHPTAIKIKSTHQQGSKSDFKAARHKRPDERKPFQWNLSIGSVHVVTLRTFALGKLDSLTVLSGET